jgi:23S rRNA (uracil1939-C5)-methyltransferase
MPEHGRKIELTLDSMAYGGDAVGRHQGMAVFVPKGLPGERVRARVTESHKTYCRAEIETMLEPSPHRVTPRCPDFGICGGCQWQMIAYPHQLELKQKVLAETLERLGGLILPEIEVIGHSNGWGYRNKAQFPVAASRVGPTMGYYRSHSHQVVPIQQCPILDPVLQAVWPQVHLKISESGISGYDEKRHEGRLRHLVLRSSRSMAQAMLALVTRTPESMGALVESLAGDISGLAGIHQNVNPAKSNTILGRRWLWLLGEPYLNETLAGARLRISPGSFLQVNLEVTARIYSACLHGLELDGSETVLDVYSGVGSIALMLAGFAGEVIGIEESGCAVDDAKAGAVASGVGNCRFLRGDAGEVLSSISSCQAVVVDPPRQGLRPEVIESLGRLSPRRLAYLSCNPSTLARDLKAFGAYGYRLTRLWLADMFPQTYHIETLAVIHKEGR